jgi:hypothetical protein
VRRGLEEMTKKRRLRRRRKEERKGVEKENIFHCG